MWVITHCSLVGAFIVFLNVANFGSILPLQHHDVAPNQPPREASNHAVSVYFTFLPPISSILVPSQRHNGTYLFFGLDGFVLHMLCERLHLNAIIHTNTDVETLQKIFFKYTKYNQIRDFHRSVLTTNEVAVMNSR